MADGIHFTTTGTQGGLFANAALQGSGHGGDRVFGTGRLDGDRLDTALIAAHEARAASDLVGLYTAAADRAEAEDRVDAACFYLTHAYVFALEAGHPAADALHARLKLRGREE